MDEAANYLDRWLDGAAVRAQQGPTGALAPLEFFRLLNAQQVAPDRDPAVSWSHFQAKAPRMIVARGADPLKRPKAKGKGRGRGRGRGKGHDSGSDVSVFTLGSLSDPCIDFSDDSSETS